MTTLQELKIEYEGILGTIKQYSKDPYVTNYLAKLKRAIQNEDLTEIKILLEKLDEWYQENIDDIEENRWVINLKSHYKTQKLLKKFKFELAS
ncbi:MAG: hypothetical protein K9L74_04480 [Candidatus Izimaplasma sp.]|nr:hypothetical protein [Candidatus Izimaplasma bacterium]